MNDDIRQIKDKIDIIDLLSEYIQLKPAGINKKACCPFHNEKTPSFMVNAERQSWHCFGCGKGGDIFTFIQEIEGMDFKETLKYLAEKAGVELSNNFQSEVKSDKKNRLKEVNLEASRFFHKFLLQMAQSQEAREYLKKRNLEEKTIIDWQIGYVPDQWDLLTKYLLKKGFSIDDLTETGLTIKKDNSDIQKMKGFYDRFRDRIMFPIWDVHDNVVGFTGRILKEKENSGGKYVNTPQTEVFDKSGLVFALNKAKKFIKEENLVVLVEGQMDVITCHQAGMKNVVASSGTALTEKQIKLLKRYSENINISFDADPAGVAAARRGIGIALSEGMHVKIIQIPDGQGKDPDECIKKNKNIWFEAVKNARPVMDWYFELAFKNKDLNNPRDKQSIADELLAEIKNIPFAVEKDFWMQKLSMTLGVNIDVLTQDLIRHKESKTNEPKLIKSFSSKEGNIFNKESDDLIRSLEVFLMLILQNPSFVEKDNFSLPFKILDRQKLSPSAYLDLYEKIFLEYTNNHKIDINKLRDLFANNSENLVDILIMKSELEFSDFDALQKNKELEVITKILKDKWLKQEKNRLELEIKKANSENNQELVDKLTVDYLELSKK
ncbi:MAG: DNA primase [Patescibacteria group bacterium]